MRLRPPTQVRVGLIVLLGTAVAVPLAAQLPQGLTKGPTVEGITEYTLANGLRVLLFPDASKPTATINITYLVGSRHEGYGETGMAHLLEHLVFKGSPKHPNIPQELTEHGSRPNGTTWFDRTNYFETVPATDVNIEWALDLEADRMVNSFIAKKDLESEFSVVRNEFESGENSPFNVLLERTMSTAYLWHNYGKSTIGARADIENVPIERLQAFYRKYYQPDNAILMVAGKIDEPKVLRLVAEKFGAIPKPARALERGNLLYPTYTAEPAQDGEREVSLRRTGDVQVVMALYHVPPLSHPDYAAVDVLSQVLGDQPAGRIYKALVETRKAAQAGAFDFALKEPGALLGWASVRKDNSLDSAKAAMTTAFDAAVTSPPTAEEVERAKTTLLRNIDLLLANSERVGLSLSEYMASGDWRLVFIHRDRVKQVTPADVKRVAEAYLKSSNRTIGLFHPTDRPERVQVPSVADA
ncbi:MAG: M16 family metallopeptidase, partial [Gemmatimonadales bacterium]